MHEKGNVPPVIRFGPFMLDGRSGELRNGPTRLKVPDQSIAVLQALLERPGELVTREELRDRLWGPDTHVDFEAGLNAAVRRLREALNDSADVPRYVGTVPRRGYRFIARVDGASTAAPPAPTDRSRRVRVRNALLATVALAVIGAALWAGLRRNHTRPIPSSAASPVPFTSFPGSEVDPAICATGTMVAYAGDGQDGDNFDIYIRSLDGSQSRLTTDAAAERSPAWSPDCQRIAFVRIQSGRRLVVVVPAPLGGPEQLSFDAGPERAIARGLSWTPDGKHLVFGHPPPRSVPSSAIHLYSFEDGQKQQLTHPPQGFADVQPVVSPDDRYLAFVRRRFPGILGGHVFVQPLDQLRPKGDPVQLTFDHGVNALDWASDSRSIIFDSGPRRGLWRVAVSGGAPVPVLPNVRAGSPSVARKGTGLVYETSAVDANIWELRIPPSADRNRPGDAFRLIDSTSIDLDPGFSPDGTRIVFASTRSGGRKIWVSKRDGSEPKLLTPFDGPMGSPSWSPDGKWIAFDASRSGGSWNLYIVPADGSGPAKPLTSDAFTNVRPSWSLDGRWIYFGSTRTGNSQIWKMPSAGGKPEQITRGGGYHPIVSPDGQQVFYTKAPPAEGIWKVLAEGGQEVQITKQGRGMGFDVADPGIFFMNWSANPVAVEMFGFASQQVVTVARLPLRSEAVDNLAVSRDGRSILYVEYESPQSDIEMLREFR
jgi:Tol biopolymer transport system component/DNA-binding winged helix-turn-helix (wHTH) protein